MSVIDLTLPEGVRPKMCNGKKKFGNISAAESSIEGLRKHRLSHEPEKLNVYKCPFCTFYHVGHRK